MAVADVNEPGPALLRPAVLAGELEPLLGPTLSMNGLQGIAADPDGEWYLHQAVRPDMVGTTGTLAEDTQIHRFGKLTVNVDGMLRARYLSTMTWVDAGHNNDVDVERVGSRLYVWGQWPSVNAAGKTEYRVIRVPWQSGIVDPATAPTVNVFEGPTRYVAPILDAEHDVLVVRSIASGLHIYTKRRLSEVMAGVNTVLGRIVLPPGDIYQGAASYGRHLYRATGTAADGTGVQSVKQYDWTTGVQVDEVDITRSALLPTEETSDWIEVEGLTVTSSGIQAGMKMHRSKRRRMRIVTVAALGPQVAPLKPLVVRLPTWPFMRFEVQA